MRIKALTLLTLLALLTACAPAGAPGAGEVSSGVPSRAPEASAVPPSPAASVETSVQANGIVISETAGNVYGDGTPYTVRLVAPEVFNIPPEVYKEFRIDISGREKEETIPLAAVPTYYVNPVLSLSDVTGDGISDIFVKLPVMGSTRPITICGIYTYVDGAFTRILDSEILNSSLAYTVTYKDNYILEIFSPSLQQTFAHDFTEAYSLHPEDFRIWDGNTDTAPMYDDKGILNPDMRPWEPEEARVVDLSAAGDSAAMGIVLKQDIWSGATSGDYVGTAVTHLQWDNTTRQFAVTEQTFEPGDSLTH